MAVDVLALPRFEILPRRRVLISFAAALVLGVPLGLWLGWSRHVREEDGWIVAGDRVSAGSGGDDRHVDQPGGLRHGSAAR